MSEISRRAVLALGAAAGVTAALGAADASAALPEPTGLEGRALRPGDRGYAAETATFNRVQVPRPGLIVAARTALLRELSTDAVDTLVSRTGQIMLAEVRHLGGALARQPEHPDAVSHRDAAFTLFLAGTGDATAVRKAEAEVIRRLAPWSTGGMYLNFMAEDDASPDAVRRAFRPDVYQRLRRLKRRVDPGNLFRLNHNIPPA